MQAHTAHSACQAAHFTRPGAPARAHTHKHARKHARTKNHAAARVHLFIQNCSCRSRTLLIRHANASRASSRPNQPKQRLQLQALAQQHNSALSRQRLLFDDAGGLDAGQLREVWRTILTGSIKKSAAAMRAPTIGRRHNICAFSHSKGHK
jgi:hypothetical protein